MAQQMTCDGCSENPAVIVVTVIQTGDVQAYDVNCMADFALAYLKNVAPEMLAPPAAKPARKRRAKSVSDVFDDGLPDSHHAADDEV